MRGASGIWHNKLRQNDGRRYFPLTDGQTLVRRHINAGPGKYWLHALRTPNTGPLCDDVSLWSVPRPYERRRQEYHKSVMDGGFEVIKGWKKEVLGAELTSKIF